MAEYYVLDENRRAVPVADVQAWARAFDNDRRRVAATEVGGYTVSTVFLGLDHQYGDGPPLLFETLVFGPAAHDGDMDRCSTWDEAEAMHERMVASIKAAAQ
jgi:hypothetical protein